MIPGPPSRGTKISRRLILGYLGGLFCHDGVMKLHGGARNTERGDEELLSNTLMNTEQRSLETGTHTQ